MSGWSLMKVSVVVSAAVAAAAIVAAATFASMARGNESSAKTVAEKPCGDRMFGHIGSLESSGGQFELRFDPAWFISGVTANAAAAEDGAVAPGEPVPNDNYVVDESHRLLTYVVSPTADVTVLTRDGGGPLGETPVTVAELAQIVNGGPHLSLLETLDSGVWIRVNVDTVCALDQQYRP